MEYQFAEGESLAAASTISVVRLCEVLVLVADMSCAMLGGSTHVTVGSSVADFAAASAASLPDTPAWLGSQARVTGRPVVFSSRSSECRWVSRRMLSRKQERF